MELVQGLVECAVVGGLIAQLEREMFRGHHVLRFFRDTGFLKTEGASAKLLMLRHAAEKNEFRFGLRFVFVPGNGRTWRSIFCYGAG